MQNAKPVAQVIVFATVLQGEAFMSENNKIKIVKKTDVVVRKSKKKKVNNSRVAAREMVYTVGEWVNDFKERKREETKAALETLFRATAQPNES